MRWTQVGFVFNTILPMLYNCSMLPSQLIYFLHTFSLTNGDVQLPNLCIASQGVFPVLALSYLPSLYLMVMHPPNITFTLRYSVHLSLPSSWIVGHIREITQNVTRIYDTQFHQDCQYLKQAPYPHCPWYPSKPLPLSTNSPHTPHQFSQSWVSCPSFTEKLKLIRPHTIVCAWHIILYTYSHPVLFVQNLRSVHTSNILSSSSSLCHWLYSSTVPSAAVSSLSRIYPSTSCFPLTSKHGGPISHSMYVPQSCNFFLPTTPFLLYALLFLVRLLYRDICLLDPKLYLQHNLLWVSL